MTDIAERMLLAGYVTLTGHGFALPAYGAGVRPNVWNVAVPAIDGDHSSSISRFDMLESEEVEPLAEDRCIEVYTGDPWHEVFLWEDTIFIGTIEQIYRDTQHLHNVIEAKAPLTMLDLSLAAQGERTVDLANSASRFLNDRLGASAGQDMFCEVVIRPSALLALRKQYDFTWPGEAFPELLREFDISQTNKDSFSIELPKGSLAALGGKEAAAGFDTAICALSERLGTKILALEDGKSLATEPTIDSPEEGPVDPTSFPQILLIALGHRAAQIARYLKIPTEILMRTGARVRVAVDDELLVGATQSSLTIVSDIPNTFELDEYETIIWLLDNETMSDTGQIEYITDMVAHLRGDAVTLLAPAPPENAPSAIVRKSPGLDRLLKQFDAVIDTTLARSPFWNAEKYSSDRQMADIITRIAVALTADLSSRKILLNPPHKEQPRLLSLQRGFPQGHDALHAAYSEMLAEPIGDSWNRVPLTSFSVPDRSQKSSQDFFISLQDMQIHFEAFATAVIAEFFRKTRLSGAFGSMETFEAIYSSLNFPEMATAFSISRGNHKTEIVLAAEAPSLQTLKIAREFDIAVMRYTDSAALHRIMFERTDNDRRLFSEIDWYPPDGTLPYEIALPAVQIPGFASGLATRGIDPRDIMRIPEAQWMEMAAQCPMSTLEREVFVFRNSVKDKDEEPIVVVPNIAIAKAADAGDALATLLIEEISPRWKAEDRHRRRSFGKFEAWARQNGSTRWLVADTYRTLKLDVLAPGQLPSQRFIVIDGDASVPLALRSRPFAVWVRAMAPHSHGTLRLPAGIVESFPFPRFMQFRQAPGGTPQLHFHENLRREAHFAELLDGLSRLEPIELAHEVLSPQSRRVCDLFNSHFLADLSLPELASDLNILDQLIERNLQDYAES